MYMQLDSSKSYRHALVFKLAASLREPAMSSLMADKMP